MEIAGHKQKHYIIIISRCASAAAAAASSFELCIVSHIWRADLFCGPHKFALRFSPLSRCVALWPVAGLCHVLHAAHTHTRLCMHSWLARGFCRSRTTVGILFIFIIFCRLNDHKLH